MTDPFSTYSEAAGSAEVCGYFERAPGHTGPWGRALWFRAADEVLPVDRRTDLAELRSRVSRHLRGVPRRAALGYLTFDAVGLMEPALARFPSGSPFPLGEVLLASAVHSSSVSNVPPLTTTRRNPIPGSPRGDSLPPRRFHASVRRLSHAIRDGEAFQVVLAHRREWAKPDDFLRRAGRLRRSERWAYFYHLRVGERELVGATPESVVEVGPHRARINPIAGTRPSQAGRRRLPLRRDRKELAEHRMLVDLARNDLGRVARPGSVRLLFRERRQRYARLEHLVSRVGAQLADRYGPWEALAATFPAGTVCGAPKIRATQLLRSEEGTWRGPYAGTVGLLLPGGRADWALAIRGAFAARSRLYTAAGAGIVYRSEPRREYEETLVKLARVEETLLGESP